MAQAREIPLLACRCDHLISTAAKHLGGALGALFLIAREQDRGDLVEHPILPDARIVKLTDKGGGYVHAVRHAEKILAGVGLGYKASLGNVDGSRAVAELFLARKPSHDRRIALNAIAPPLDRNDHLALCRSAVPARAAAALVDSGLVA